MVGAADGGGPDAEHGEQREGLAQDHVAEDRAGAEAAGGVGELVAAHVIPRPHSSLDERLPIVPK